jgi:hypothetical protein
VPLSLRHFGIHRERSQSAGATCGSEDASETERWTTL